MGAVLVAAKEDFCDYFVGIVAVAGLFKMEEETSIICSISSDRHCCLSEVLVWGAARFLELLATVD